MELRFAKWLETIDHQEIYRPGDTVEVVEDVVDYDTGRVMVKKGQRGKVSGMPNPEYVSLKLDNGEFFYAYVLNIRKIWDPKFKIGDRVEATKDIYDQMGYKVVTPRGEKGVIKGLKSKEWPKVRWEDSSKGNDVGVHVSEIEKVGKGVRK